MATILNIETSGSPCSAALTSDGMILAHREDFEGRNHATMLSGFVKACLDHAREHEMQLDAVAVSMGPGSYTGLRIGLSEAKGLAYALDIPLIGIDTLKLLATRVMFSTDDIDPDTIFIPMVDARRMEVYTAAYDFALNEMMKPQALILDENSYSELRMSGRPILYFGSGAAKAQGAVCRHPGSTVCARSRSLGGRYDSLGRTSLCYARVYRHGIFDASISKRIPSNYAKA